MVIPLSSFRVAKYTDDLFKNDAISRATDSDQGGIKMKIVPLFSSSLVQVDITSQIEPDAYHFISLLRSRDQCRGPP